jgi:hypothetical protein
VVVGVSILFAAIEVRRGSKAALADCLTASALIYAFLLTIANVVATIIAMPLATRLVSASSPYFFLISAVAGTFGFESVLRETNVTVRGNGILAIKEWLDKSLDQAVASAIERQENTKQEVDQKLQAKLRLLREDEINAMILQKIDAGALAKLDADATASGADSKLYKILQLVALLKRSESRALLKRP